MDLKRLQGVPLFEALSKKELQALGRVVDEVEVTEGQVLTREGDIGHELFVIDSGAVRVERDGALIAELEAGDYFGEMALISEVRRVATVTATKATRVLVMSAAGFRSTRHTAPAVYERVEQELAKRRTANDGDPAEQALAEH